MPAFVNDSLEGRRLMDAYHKRPSDQQNDYVGWISDGRREQTRQRRKTQMLQELEQGGIYMKMQWRGGRSA
ncbi:MAG: YdeI/OmpD-associated family protein [Dehalococcoidia bacterium]|nr:YdeI/OmpD-associated family protein [Dehalococcoidia bacterium]